MMLWWQNIPFFTIMLCLFSAALCSVLSWKAARIWTLSVLGLCSAGGIILLTVFRYTGASQFVFSMGHFPAPWGNEIRAGQLEAFLASLFPLIMLCALSGGCGDLLISSRKTSKNLYHALCLLLTSSLLSQIYSNDLFTCYVFLEIMTLTACALIISRESGHALAAGMRYMVLNMVGSGLFLLGIALLYDLTGHLLMEPLHEHVQTLYSSGDYRRSLTLILAVMTVGLCIKSALFPFHSWVPDAYSSGFPSSNAILSSLVSKGYIVLLLKLLIRVFGWDLILFSGINHLLLCFAMAGMIIGSLAAFRSDHLLRMTAWSSVSQIGYIFLGIGLGADHGYEAALFHLTVHSLSKSLLFLSGAFLIRFSGSGKLSLLQGSARNHKTAGICWTIGAFSIVGLPFTGGLVSKYLLGEAALHHSAPVALLTLLVLALSTFLNVLYFLRTVLSLWSPSRENAVPDESAHHLSGVFSCSVLAFLVFLSFFAATPFLSVLRQGLEQF